MKRYRATERVSFGSGQQLGLTDAQIANRRHNIRIDQQFKGGAVVTVQNPIEFKAGEIIAMADRPRSFEKTLVDPDAQQAPARETRGVEPFISRSEHNAALKTVEDRHKGAISAMEDRHKLAMATAVTEHEKALQSSQDQHAAALKLINGERDALLQAAQSEKARSELEKPNKTISAASAGRASTEGDRKSSS